MSLSKIIPRWMVFIVIVDAVIGTNTALASFESTISDISFHSPSHANFSDKVDVVDAEILQVGGQSFQPVKNTVQGRDTTLIAKGASYLTFFSLAICSAVLYLEPWAPNDVVLSLNSSHSFVTSSSYNSSLHSLQKTSSIALEISYHKPVRASDFRWATTTYTTKNGHVSSHIQEMITSFNSFYRDVRRGDRYLLEYHPNHNGVSLSLNGDLLGSVGKGSPYEMELAHAIYSIWFGERPFFDRLKKDLLTPI